MSGGKKEKIQEVAHPTRAKTQKRLKSLEDARPRRAKQRAKTQKHPKIQEVTRPTRAKQRAKSLEEPHPKIQEVTRPKILEVPHQSETERADDNRTHGGNRVQV